MTEVDARGCAVTGADPAALASFERALAAFVNWRTGAEVELDRALEEAPGFVMAHVLQAYLLVCGRDLRRLRSAPPVLARAAQLPANARERGHLAAIAAVIADDYERMKAVLGELLRAHPRDVLALHVSHAFDYVTGDSARMRERAAAVLPAWTGDLPGRHAVLAMHAFALQERGDYGRAEQVARSVLAVDPNNARAHHVMAHVFEMTGRADPGMRWMSAHAEGWGAGSSAATHCAWHLALFHLAQGEAERALALYDKRVRLGRSGEIADLIDAAALLWRIELRGGDAGARWAELAAAWAPHIDDRFCSFSDLHAMLAFIGARDWDSAQRLERTLASGQMLWTRHGYTTRVLGLPACRALIAFGRGDDGLAITLLASLSPLAHRLGGSHAQRDVLALTLQRALERSRERDADARANPADARPCNDHVAWQQWRHHHAGPLTPHLRSRTPLLSIASS